MAPLNFLHIIMFKFAIQTDNGHEEETRMTTCNDALRDQFGMEMNEKES